MHKIASQLALYVRKSGDEVLIAGLEKNPSGGGWRVDDHPIKISWSEFMTNPRSWLQHPAKAGESHTRHATVYNKQFFRDYNELAVAWYGDGSLTVASMVRQANGISAIQSDDPMLVAGTAGDLELAHAFESALKRLIAMSGQTPPPSRPKHD